MLHKLVKYSIIFILALTVVLLVAYGVSKSNFSKLNKHNEDEYAIKNIREKMQYSSKEKQKFSKEMFYTHRVTIKSDNIANIGDFTVNIANNKKLILNISLKFKNKNKNSWIIADSAKNEILAKGDILRDSVIKTFSNSKEARVTNYRMKNELAKKMNSYLSNTEIEEVYFNRWIIQ